MKTFVPVLALAAGVSATFNRAPPFTCPGNTDNKCTDKQKPGFDWKDLDFGDFFNYGDFNFNGWKCEDDGDKRGRFAPRTNQKAIGGTCHSDKKKSPSFGCGPSLDKFSLGSIHVKPEFDCDLEFHYDMPDGSSCKHRSSCRKSGTTVVNKQCGGAKNVTIVYPPQPNKPKPSCSIKVPTISFDCSSASSTKPPKTTKTTKTKTKDNSTTPPVTTTTTTPGQPSSANTPPAETTTTSVSPGGSTSAPPAETSTTSVSPGEPSSTVTPGGGSSTPSGGESTTVTPGGGESTTVTPGGGESSTSVAPEQPSTTAVTSTITTSYDSTSTIFTTSTQTITSCEPTVTKCPANSVTTTVVTIAVSTTICPVTETLTTVVSSAVPTPATTSKDTPATTSKDTPGGGSGTTGTTGIVSSSKPVPTLPCPSVVPSCLNTFLFTVGCSDNTDAACYCPDAAFVKNVFDCLYAHGETDAIIAEAVAYFQGICGKYVNENPAIATDATVTTYITVTAAPTVAPVYTTVIVDVTTVVPCTNDAGEVIPSSSSTVTVSTSITVPQVDFTTGASGSVDVIPITAAPIVTGSAGSGSGNSPITTGVPVPTGTGSLRPTTTGRPVVVGAGGRVEASFGMAAVAALLAAAAL